MKIIWKYKKKDIERLKTFVKQQNNAFVKSRISRNIKRKNLLLNKNTILKSMIMCLLTTQQRSGPKSPVAIFLKKMPFPFTNQNIIRQTNTETFIRKILIQNGLHRYIKRIPKFYTSNIRYIQNSNWQILKELKILKEEPNKLIERQIAGNIQEIFHGFGPKQSRNFLQSLGLTKYEIPIDSRITTWLNNFGFPVVLSSTALQDKGYYHFVLDGLQQLCEEAGIYPCVLDAAIFSSFDNDQWNQDNVIY